MIENEQNKYEQALSLYNTSLNDEAISAKVEQIIRDKVAENNTPEVKKFLLGCVELTSLKTTDSEESILRLTECVNQFDEDYPALPHVATICVYPCYAGIVSQSLEVEGVEVACVSGNFPSSQALLEVKTIETALAIKDGATEIDMVMSVGKFLNGDYESVCDEISEIKAVCGEHALKVILETGLLPSASAIKKASILAMYSGADYIKTSTGKESPAATPQAAYVMCQAIGDALDGKAGIDDYCAGLTAGQAENFVPSEPVIDTDPYNYRTTAGNEEVNGLRLKDLVGGTMAINQLVGNNDTSVTVPSGHKPSLQFAAERHPGHRDTIFLRFLRAKFPPFVRNGEKYEILSASEMHLTHCDSGI